MDQKLNYYIRNAPLTEGVIKFNEEDPTQLVQYLWETNKSQQQDRIFESGQYRRGCILQYKPEFSHWKHCDRDDGGYSEEIFKIIAIKNREGSNTLETLDTNIIKIGERKPYTLIDTILRPTQPLPTMINGRPYTDEVNVLKRFQRVDETIHEPPPSSQSIVNLEPIHNSFANHSGYSLQLVDCFARFPGALNLPGQSVVRPQFLMPLRLNHLTSFNSRGAGKSGTLIFRINRDNLITPERLSEEDLIRRTISVQKTSYIDHDDIHQTNTIYTGKDEIGQESLEIVPQSNMIWDGRVNHPNHIQRALGRILPPEQIRETPAGEIMSPLVFTETKEWHRPYGRGTYGESSGQVSYPVRELFLEWEHFPNQQEIARGFARQVVRIEAQFSPNVWSVAKNRYVKNRVYPYLARCPRPPYNGGLDRSGWEDNRTTNRSRRFQEFYIESREGTDDDDPRIGRIIDYRQEVEQERHTNLSIIANFLPGYSWKIEHSGQKY